MATEARTSRLADRAGEGRRDFLRLLAASLLGSTPASAWPGPAPTVITAPNAGAMPVNQLAISGNACGPAALLTAFRCGNVNWQQAARVPGNSDREQLSWVIRRHALVRSSHLPDRTRWHRTRGINVADLTDIANEMAAPLLLPRVASRLLFAENREDPAKLLRRVHSHLATSLRKGLPPVASLRRYTRRPGSDGNPQWVTLEGHFVVVTAIPAKLPTDARTFSFDYIDPWGGKRLTGTCRAALPPAASPVRKGAAVDSLAAPACLEADCPGSLIGLGKVHPGDQTTVAFEAIIGRP